MKRREKGGGTTIRKEKILRFFLLKPKKYQKKFAALPDKPNPNEF